mmetsp:Transcript_31645/g.80714  ORF Transcript_31645/g.80714 Transcript_31645/m.80714 type:complete len:239 (+) Transcript_31645:293-1009(+)
MAVQPAERLARPHHTEDGADEERLHQFLVLGHRCQQPTLLPHAADEHLAAEGELRVRVLELRDLLASAGYADSAQGLGRLDLGRRALQILQLREGKAGSCHEVLGVFHRLRAEYVASEIRGALAQVEEDGVVIVSHRDPCQRVLALGTEVQHVRARLALALLEVGLKLRRIPLALLLEDAGHCLDQVLRLGVHHIPQDVRKRLRALGRQGWPIHLSCRCGLLVAGPVAWGRGRAAAAT